MKITPFFILTLLFSNASYADCQQAKPYYDQAIIAKKDKNLEQALANFKQSAELCPRYAVYFEQGKVLVKLNQLDGAIASYTKALNFSKTGSSEKANLFASIAIVYFKQGSLQQASVYAEQAYEIKKQNSPENIVNLRKAIDLKNATHVSTAEEINQTLFAKKAFGVKPKVKFNSITFKFNSTELTSQGKQQVHELSKVLLTSLKDDNQALLIGHTDKIGEESYNLVLSTQRAEAVKQALINQNSDFSGSLKTVGKGESELRYQGDSEQDHQLNRRVEMELL